MAVMEEEEEENNKQSAKRGSKGKLYIKTMLA